MRPGSIAERLTVCNNLTVLIAKIQKKIAIALWFYLRKFGENRTGGAPVPPGLPANLRFRAKGKQRSF